MGKYFPLIISYREDSGYLVPSCDAKLRSGATCGTVAKPVSKANKAHTFELYICMGHTTDEQNNWDELMERGTAACYRVLCRKCYKKWKRALRLPLRLQVDERFDDTKWLGELASWSELPTIEQASRERTPSPEPVCCKLRKRVPPPEPPRKRTPPEPAGWNSILGEGPEGTMFHNIHKRPKVKEDWNFHDDDSQTHF